jgi:preprotein translocase subunit SecA
VSLLPDRLQARLQFLSDGLMRRRLKKWAELLPRVASFEDELKALNTHDFRKRSLSLRYRAKSQEPLERIMPEAYALVREAGRRSLNMRHFDVQILGGIAIHYRSIAEMQTGEGKTLTATLPMYLEALIGKGALLATVNDYLARRDADWMKPLYETLGMSVGVVESQMQQPDRRKAYACDVTYGTAKEFGFDFLRDRLLLRRIGEGQTDFLGSMLGDSADAGGGDKPVQRPAHFVLVDEADSILIDEARTPLIISALPSEEQKIAVEAYKWSSDVAAQFVEDEHYEWDHRKRSVELNGEGRRLVRNLAKPAAMHRMGMFTIYEYIERSIKVAREFILDRHFIIRDDEIVIVDEFTGRLAEGRKWRAGIHQAIEAKEGVKVSVETGQAARVTVQDFFLMFPRLGGMTGTASSSARELRKIYRLNVVPIPTNRPAIRERWPDRVFGTAEQKWQAIVDEVCEVHATGRPVLIGTRSIDKSELLSAILRVRGIQHQVLNANQVALEAELVSKAGQLNKVMVSTNMAGRGTDIKLGEGVQELGGLHVVCTEMHDSARIDRQLLGRCGRQGDPGTFRFFLALDDELLLGLGPDKAERLKEIGKGDSVEGEALDAESNETDTPSEVRPVTADFNQYAPQFRRAQQLIERRHFRDRRVLMYHEKERKKMQRQMGQDPYLDTPG